MRKEDEDLDQDDDGEDGRAKRWLPHAGIGAIVIGFAIGIYAIVTSLGGTAPPPQPKVQQISIVQPPPPPPPPPDMEPPPPEPEQEVDVPEPEPEPVAQDESDEPPPGEDLGLDAEGVAGADGFGLRAKKGGRGLIGGGDANRWYAGVVQTDLQRLLADNDELRRGRYSVIVRIWVDANGRLTKSEVVGTSGDAARDSAIARALENGATLSQSPPEDMPQPIKLRISSRS
jgi:protein TonB